MADLTKVTTIADNTREVVMAFQYQYVDTGNESAVSKIDVSALAANADGNACTGIRIVECWWVISAMTVEILAAADTNVIIMHLTEGQSGYQDLLQLCACLVCYLLSLQVLLEAVLAGQYQTAQGWLLRRLGVFPGLSAHLSTVSAQELCQLIVLYCLSQ